MNLISWYFSMISFNISNRNIDAALERIFISNIIISNIYDDFLYFFHFACIWYIFYRIIPFDKKVKKYNRKSKYYK